MDLIEYNKIRNSTPIQSAIINVTDQCNLRCPYCFTAHNNRVSSIETIQKAINFVLNDIKRFDNAENYPVNFTFFGGEPMLHFEDIIKPIILWAKQKPEAMHFDITTNGTLLNEDNLSFLFNHNANILLSIDGDKETQDDQRPGANGQSSFDLIDIPLILKYFPNVTFRSAVEPRNVNKILDNYIFARKQGFTQYFLTPNVSAKWTMEDLEVAMAQITGIGEIFYNDLKQNSIPLNWSTLTSGLLDIFAGHYEQTAPLTYSRCGIGVTSIGVATNGDIYCCQEHNTYQDITDIFLIGNINNGIDINRHITFLNAYTVSAHPFCVENPERCNSCSFFNKCIVSFCPSHSPIKTNLLASPEVQCIWNDFCYRLAAQWVDRALRENNLNVAKYFEQNLITRRGANE